MKLEKALKIFRISNESTVKDLNSNFRKLAKRYHPDFNRGREDWAHTMMTKLNLAYEVALDYLTVAKKPEEKLKKDETKRKFLGNFNRAIDQVLDGIYLYYQYGLENVNLRKEGIRKIRYTDSIRQVKNGILKLEDLKAYSLNFKEKESLYALSNFSKAFLQNTFIERLYIPSSDAYEHDAYKLYYEGCNILDYSIKEALFGDMLIQVKKGAFYKNLDICREQFMMVVTRYYRSSWLYESLFKIYLLEVFLKVTEIFKRMRY